LDKRYVRFAVKEPSAIEQLATGLQTWVCTPIKQKETPNETPSHFRH
jgi:hypothetical protein